MNLDEILSCHRLTSIVDVGASLVDGPPPYADMLKKRLCTVQGFEPNSDELAKLDAKKSDLEEYRADVIGDGRPANLFHCSSSGMTSLLRPDDQVLSCFQPFRNAGAIIKTEPVQTVRLEDTGVGWIDMLKIDIQGGEWAVFDSSPNIMGDVVCVHTEISFVPMYVGQVPFGEVDFLLRSYGLIPHFLFGYKPAMIGPLYSPNKPWAAFKQALDGDIVYVRDFTKMDKMSDEQMKHLAMVAHYVYGSTDLVVRCLTWLMKRGRIPLDSSQLYVDGTNGA